MNYKQTKLFSEFQCVGNGCINNCCHHLDIVWSGDGVEKLKTANGCSDELRRLIQCSFVQREDGKFTIQLKENDVCPFQLENGLCIIQKELGGEYLSDDCTVFPRFYFAAGQTVYCGCSLSCPEVIKGLINEDNSAALLTMTSKPDIRGRISSVEDYPEFVEKRSEFKRHKEMLEFFYELISDKRFSVETNIVRGALAAEKLNEAVKEGGGRKIAGVTADLREALETDEVIQAVESIQPEYEAKLKMLTCYTESLFGTALADLFRDGSGNADAERFAFAEKQIKSVFGNRPFRFRNIILNLLMELGVPLRYVKRSIYENYCEFAVVAAVIKMSIMAAAMSDRLSLKTNDGAYEFQGEDCVTGMCSFVARHIIQSKGMVDVLFTKFSGGMVTPRDVAMLIK